MKKIYVKSLKEYKDSFDLDTDRIIESMKRYKNIKKKPTSIALDQRTIEELKVIGEKKGLPYQVLMRIFILDGLARLKKST